MPREAEATGAANGPGACELPACAGLAPVSAEVHFEGNAGECPPMAEAGEDQMNEELRLRLAAALQADDEPAPEPQPEPQAEPAMGKLPQPGEDMPTVAPPSPHIEGRGVTYSFVQRLIDARS